MRQSLFAAACVIAMGLYMGSYLLLVEPNYKYPRYRLGGYIAEWSFAPVHYVDVQLVRPSYWTTAPTLQTDEP
jgi:hypothetical protein